MLAPLWCSIENKKNTVADRNARHCKKGGYTLSFLFDDNKNNWRRVE